MGLGSFPTVTLAQARDNARNARQTIEGGTDPIASRASAKSQLRAQQATQTTFEQASLAYIDSHSEAWRNAKHRAQWSSTLETYAYPVMGKLLVQDVHQEHVLKVLEPIWKSKNETAMRLRGRIEMVLDWATVRKLRSGENPARWKGHLDHLLAAPNKVKKTAHHRALPIDAMSQFMAKLRAADGVSARALEFAILTAARSGEVRGATWAEIDLNSRVWTVPAQRMKAGVEHRVPLSEQAIVLLKALPGQENASWLFPGAKGGPLSDMSLTAVLRRMGVDAVPHGFRSTFRDWAGERTSYPRELAEQALAHTLQNKVEAAYRRGDALEKRRTMMEDWANFATGPSRDSIHQ
jgi:integrase